MKGNYGQRRCMVNKRNKSAFNVLNTEYRIQRHTNVHAHLSIVFDCRDAIKIYGELWLQKLPTSRTII